MLHLTMFDNDFGVFSDTAAADRCVVVVRDGSDFGDTERVGEYGRFG